MQYCWRHLISMLLATRACFIIIAVSESAADEVVKAPVVNQWAGEDEAEDDGQMNTRNDMQWWSSSLMFGFSLFTPPAAPDAWDAEPEEKPAKDSTPVLPVEKQKVRSERLWSCKSCDKSSARLFTTIACACFFFCGQVVTKRALAKKEEEERKMAERQAAAARNDPSQAAAERERLRRMEEDRDAALAGDLFGAEHTRTEKDPAGSQVDYQGAEAAAAAAALNPMAAAAPAPATASAASASAAAAGGVVSAALLKPGARIDELVLDTDADVTRFVSDFGKRLEKLGKSALASKKVLALISGVMEEAVKVGVLRVDEVGELKRIATVRHNDMNTKMKKGDKKKVAAAAAKPVVALARNAFMVRQREQRADCFFFHFWRSHRAFGFRLLDLVLFCAAW
jgi:hypothetical protein